MKIIAITQARYGSSRLPGKILKPLGDITLLELHIARALTSSRINKLVVATTQEKESAEIERLALKAGCTVYKGSLEDVLDRFYQAAVPEEPDYIVRITSDCPLIDGQLIDAVIDRTLKGGHTYCQTSGRYPDGVDVEVFTFGSLLRAHAEATLSSDREHVTAYIRRNAQAEHAAAEYPCDADFSGVRFTVDEPADLETVRLLTKRLGENAGWLDYTNDILQNPALFANQSVTRNEGYIKSLNNDTATKDR